MATISYRPELENPSRDADLSFAYADKGKMQMATFTLKPGVNRNVDDRAWSVVESTPAMQALIKIRAVEVLEAAETTAPAGSANAPELSDVIGLPVVDAFKVIEGTFDEEFLESWKRAEGRSTVINKINQRLKNVRQGEG